MGWDFFSGAGCLFFWCTFFLSFFLVQKFFFLQLPFFSVALYSLRFNQPSNIIFIFHSILNKQLRRVEHDSQRGPRSDTFLRYVSPGGRKESAGIIFFENNDKNFFCTRKEDKKILHQKKRHPAPAKKSLPRIYSIYRAYKIIFNVVFTPSCKCTYVLSTSIILCLPLQYYI